MKVAHSPCKTAYLKPTAKPLNSTTPRGCWGLGTISYLATLPPTCVQKLGELFFFFLWLFQGPINTKLWHMKLPIFSCFWPTKSQFHRIQVKNLIIHLFTYSFPPKGSTDTPSWNTMTQSGQRCQNKEKRVTSNHLKGRQDNCTGSQDETNQWTW